MAVGSNGRDGWARGAGASAGRASAGIVRGAGASCDVEFMGLQLLFSVFFN